MIKFDDIIRFCKANRYAVVYGALGFISAILMLIIGFFSTLLILLLTALGITVGYLIDKVGAKGTWELVRRIIGKK